MTRKAPLVVIAMTIVGLWWLFRLPAGVATSETIPNLRQPQQTDPIRQQGPEYALALAGYEWRLEPRAHYAIAARVLSSERYWLGWQSVISPVDLALGWGDLEDPRVDKWLSWSQGARWYIYRWKADCPLSGREISLQSANVHVIPASSNLRRAVLKLRRNHRVYMEGHLVNVTGSKGDRNYHWNTSLTRNDTGDGSCEVFYLEKLLWKGKTYS